MHLQTALAKGDANWICSMVAAANSGTIIGTDVWYWVTRFYENEEALSKRVESLLPLIQGVKATGKNQNIWFKGFMESITQYQLVHATKEKYGYDPRLPDYTAKQLFISASAQLDNKSGYMATKGSETFAEVLETYSSHLALDQSVTDQFVMPKVRRVAAGKPASKPGNHGRGETATPK